MSAEACVMAPRWYYPAQMQTEFDDTDRAILRELQEDGRRSFRAIARSVGVSEGTVRSRVRRIGGRALTISHR